MNKQWTIGAIKIDKKLQAGELTAVFEFQSAPRTTKKKFEQSTKLVLTSSSDTTKYANTPITLVIFVYCASFDRFVNLVHQDLTENSYYRMHCLKRNWNFFS